MLFKAKKKKTIFIKTQEINSISNVWFKMNKIINKFLLTEDKLMPELHLKQSGFTYSACGPFTKQHEKIQKFKETCILKHLYRNELDRTCFTHNVAYSDDDDDDEDDKLFCGMVDRRKAFNLIFRRDH